MHISFLPTVRTSLLLPTKTRLHKTKLTGTSPHQTYHCRRRWCCCSGLGWRSSSQELPSFSPSIFVSSGMLSRGSVCRIWPVASQCRHDYVGDSVYTGYGYRGNTRGVSVQDMPWRDRSWGACSSSTTVQLCLSCSMCRCLLCSQCRLPTLAGQANCR